MRGDRSSPSHRARLGLATVLTACLAAPAYALEPGDSNRDLRVSAPDFTVLMQILNGDTAGNDGADADRNGFVLPNDIAATAHRLFGAPLSEPTATPTSTAAATPTATATSSVTPTASSTSASTSTATATRTPTASLSPTLGATATRTATPSASPSFTATPTRTRTPSPTSTGTIPTPTRTASPSVTSTFTVTPTRTGTPTRTSTRTPTASVTPTATGTSRPPPLTVCSNTLPTPLSIPDGVPSGTSNSFLVDAAPPIVDLNVDVRIDHTYVGDLRVLLTHVEAGSTVVLIDQEDNPQCQEDDISAVFDDEAARFVGNVCSSIDDVAIGGGVAPPGSLSVFAGQNLAGTWRLDVVDLVGQDTGRLVSWCLRANSTAPVVTRVACNGDSECTVALGQPVVIDFDFADPDANATSFLVTARNQAGSSFNIGSRTFAPTGMDTYNVNLSQGFQCPTPPCNTTLFEFRVEVTDAEAQTSPFASVVITSLGTQ